MLGEAYVSNSLSSGGAKRIYANKIDPGHRRISSIQHNSQFADYTAQMIGGLFDEPHITLPHKVGKRDKWGEYQLLLNTYVSFIRHHGIPINPVSRMGSMPDHRESLGCSMEDSLGAHLHVPRGEILFNEAHDAFGLLAQAAPWLTFPEVRGTIKADSNSIAIYRNIK